MPFVFSRFLSATGRTRPVRYALIEVGRHWSSTTSGTRRQPPGRGLIPCLVLSLAVLFLAAQADVAVAGGSRASTDTSIEFDQESPDVDQTLLVAVPRPTPLAIRYHRSGVVVWLAGAAWGMAIPALILFTGLSAKLRDFAFKLGRSRLLVIPIYAILYLLIDRALDLPLDFYAGYVRPHAYGLSQQSWLKWFGNVGISLGVSITAASLFLWVPFLVLRKFPGRWWLYVGLLTFPFAFFATMVKPVLVDPLFNKFGEMKDKRLEAKILALAAEAGIEGGRIFEVDKSRDTSTVNAYVTGLVGTKRIVLWDTLLAKLDDDEVLVVMAHEMGHYVLNHVLWGITLTTFGSVGMLFLVDRLARVLIGRYSRRFGFNSLADVAAVPLLVFLLQLIGFAGAPIGLAVSREIEHQADRYALDLRRTNHSAASAFVKLAKENLGDPRPPFLLKLWRASHPPIRERIDFCNDYHPWRSRPPLIREAGDPETQP